MLTQDELKQRAAKIRECPGLMSSYLNGVPPVIDSSTVELFEAGIGYQHNYGYLLPHVSQSFSFYLNQPFDGNARQVEVFARVLNALAQAGWPHLDVKDTVGLMRQVITPALKTLPLGKKYRDEWMQPDARGLPLLQWLVDLYQSVSVINQRVELSATQQSRLDTQLNKLGRQIEACFKVSPFRPGRTGTDRTPETFREVI